MFGLYLQSQAIDGDNFHWVAGFDRHFTYRVPVLAFHENLAAGCIDAASGKVFVEGEYWNAVSEVPIEPGHPVEIVAVNGLTLKVKPKQTPIT